MHTNDKIFKLKQQYEVHTKDILFDWVLRHIDTVYVIWRRSSFTGGGRHQERPSVHYFRHERAPE
jgi:hypothetical protein